MKKTVIAVTLLALLMSGCNKPTSAASASDVTSASPSTSPISDSVPVVSDSVSSSASPSTSVDSDSNHQVTKEVFLRLLTTGLANATMTLTNTETEDGETSTTTTYLSYANDVACLSQPGYSLSYLRLKDKVLTQADAEIENGTIVYNADYPEDLREKEENSVWEHDILNQLLYEENWYDATDPRPAPS